MSFEEWYSIYVAPKYYHPNVENVAELAWDAASELKQGEITILQAQIATLQEAVAAAQLALAGAPAWAQGHRDAIALLKELSEQNSQSEYFTARSLLCQ